MTETTMMASETQTTAPSVVPGGVEATAEALYGKSQEAAKTQTAPAAEPAKGSEPTATGQDAKVEAKANADAKTSAPEKYEFAAPEGREFDVETIAAYSEVARELGLSQEAAQKLLDRMGPTMATRQQTQIQAVREGWAKSSNEDKEFGGSKLPENLSVAKKALDAFGSPELRTLLNESGLGNHPEVIRFFFRAGNAISEDRFVGGSAGKPKGQPKSFADLADALYS